MQASRLALSTRASWGHCTSSSSQENALTLSAIGGHGDGLARLIAQSNPLTHVFSTDSSDPFLEDLQSLDEMQVDVSTTSFQDLSWYGSDLDLAPLPEVKSEHSLREAAALAHKMELFRSMSTEADALSDDCLVGSHNMAVDDRSATSARSMASSSAKLRIAAVNLEGLQLQPPIIISTSSLMGGTDTTTWDFPESPRTAVCSFARPKSAGLLSPAGNSGSASDVDAPTTDIEEKRQVTKKKTSQGRPAKPLTKTMDTSQHTPKQSTISLQSQKLKKKRVVKKDPNRQRSKPWTQEELTQFRILLQEDGASNWLSKAEKLGTGRTAKSLHTRWLRDEGRIVDRPRGANAKPDGQPDGEEISV